MAHLFTVHDGEFGYRDVLSQLLTTGERVAPRGIDTREISDVTIVHTQPQDLLLTGVGRKLSIGLAAVEALQLVGGFSDPELTTTIAPRYRDFMDGDDLHGAYGLRTRLKTGLVAERLRQDPSTRRACMTFWEDSKDLTQEGLHDYPCTMHVNFRVRFGHLDMTIVMRSNDAWLGYPYDIVQFCVLQSTMAAFLKLSVGHYTHIAHSFHIYERDVESAMALVSEPPREHQRTQLTGGIVGNTDEWSSVQHRAKTLCYRPERIEPRTVTERWLHRVVCNNWKTNA